MADETRADEPSAPSGADVAVGPGDESPEASPSGKGSYQTVGRHPTGGNHWPYSVRMTLYFALIALMTAVVLVCVLAVVWQGEFRRYARENMQRVADTTAEQVSELYVSEGDWTQSVLVAASTASSFSDDIGVQVLDLDGRVIYDDTVGNRSAQALDEGAPPEAMVSADVTDASGGTVGRVVLWAFGSDSLFTGADESFRRSSYQAIVLAAFVAVALAVAMGRVASRALSKPVEKVTRAAARIRSGDLTARTGMTGTDEIGRLGETFDGMATTIERDIKHERRLTSDVAHELRTPLMAMLVTVEAMQDDVLPRDNEHLETVASEIRRLSRLVDAMLHLSKLENGTRELKIQTTNLVSLARNLVSSQHQMFHEKGLHLRFNDETARGELKAEVDPDLIQEALVNLLSNAMRYTNEGGWVVVSVGAERDRCVLTVRDTGIGIAPEDIPKMFSRFWRSDVSRQRVSGGLGVGLSITKEIVDRHNGTISVESELGKGTTFTIRIPQRHAK